MERRLLGQYQNGNVSVSIYSDGTKIRETEDDEFKPAFAENMDIKICDRCNVGCAFCHEGSSPNGRLGDLHENFIETLHPYQEVALGGGDIFEHPGILNLLVRLSEKKVITNITINQATFEKHYELIKRLSDRRWVYGVGVSLVEVTSDFLHKIKTIDNAVVHVINGIFTEEDEDLLALNGLKILILGYKHLRRGYSYYNSNAKTIEYNMKWLYNALPQIMRDNDFATISFDNLALEQLNAKRLITPEQWDLFYAGDDGSFTYYIDMVNRQFALSSTAPFDERYPLMDNVDEMFQVIQAKHCTAEQN